MIEFENILFVGFMGLGLPELLIVAAVFLLLFGGAKLPGLMRNLGRSVNEFKTGIKETPVDADLDDLENTKKSIQGDLEDADLEGSLKK
jgi:sec-independent protein translocase protein TatA